MEQRFYLGIDLDDQYAVISSYELNKKEPETFSAIAGSEIYQIPALITKKKGIGQWFVGEEAVRLAIAQGEEANGRLLSRAVGGEKVFVDGETYPAEELLTLYLKKTDTTGMRPRQKMGAGTAGHLYGKAVAGGDGAVPFDGAEAWN